MSDHKLSLESTAAELLNAASATPDAAAAPEVSQTESPPDVTMIALAPRKEASRSALPADIAPSAPLPPAMTLHDAAATPSETAAPPAATTAPDPAARIGDAPKQAQTAAALASAKAALANLAAKTPSLAPRHGAYAGGVAAALAAGWFGAAFLTAPAPARPDSAAIAAAQTAAQLERLTADVRALRDSVAALGKAQRPRGPDDLKQVQERLANLAENIDKARSDQSAKLAALSGGVDRVEKLDRDLGNRMTQLAERLDRIERQNAPQVTGSITPQPAAPAATPAAPPPQVIPTPPPRPDSVTSIEKPATPPAKAIEGWALRDMYDGVALIENRRLGMLEVAPGQTVRGLGRIEKFEKRGKQWVVVTEQGFIAAN